VIGAVLRMGRTGAASGVSQSAFLTQRSPRSAEDAEKILRGYARCVGAICPAIGTERNVPFLEMVGVSKKLRNACWRRMSWPEGIGRP
jgi:hypothetical protein